MEALSHRVGKQVTGELFKKLAMPQMTNYQHTIIRCFVNLFTAKRAEDFDAGRPRLAARGKGVKERARREAARHPSLRAAYRKRLSRGLPLLTAHPAVI